MKEYRILSVCLTIGLPIISPPMDYLLNPITIESIPALFVSLASCDNNSMKVHMDEIFNLYQESDLYHKLQIIKLCIEQDQVLERLKESNHTDFNFLLNKLEQLSVSEKHGLIEEYTAALFRKIETSNHFNTVGHLASLRAHIYTNRSVENNKSKIPIVCLISSIVGAALGVAMLYTHQDESIADLVHDQNQNQSMIISALAGAIFTGPICSIIAWRHSCLNPYSKDTEIESQLIYLGRVSAAADCAVRDLVRVRDPVHDLDDLV